MNWLGRKDAEPVTIAREETEAGLRRIAAASGDDPEALLGQPG